MVDAITQSVDTVPRIGSIEAAELHEQDMRCLSVIAKDLADWNVVGDAARDYRSTMIENASQIIARDYDSRLSAPMHWKFGTGYEEVRGQDLATGLVVNIVKNRVADGSVVVGNVVADTIIDYAVQLGQLGVLPSKRKALQQIINALRLSQEGDMSAAQYNYTNGVMKPLEAKQKEWAVKSALSSVAVLFAVLSTNSIVKSRG